jgi:hypothetical protein
LHNTCQREWTEVASAGVDRSSGRDGAEAAEAAKTGEAGEVDKVCAGQRHARWVEHTQVPDWTGSR